MSNYRIKLVIVGDSYVGKSSLIKRYADDAYNPDRYQTIGIDFKLKRVIRNGNVYRIQLWDTAGQERFRNIVSAYYRDANLIVIAFDLTNQDSILSVNYWLGQVSTQNPHLPRENIIIVGLKADMEEHLIPDSKVNAMIEPLGIKYFKVSAKTGENVEAAFTYLLEQCKKNSNELEQFEELFGLSDRNKQTPETDKITSGFFSCCKN